MITNKTRGRTWQGKVKPADTFFRRFRGLMLVGNVNHALVFILPAETRVNASIHTFFMLSDIDVVWLDSTKRVVDSRTARKWRVYAPKDGAKYLIEGPVGLLKTLDVHDGDLIEWNFTDDDKKALSVKVSLRDKISFESGNGMALTESVKETKTKEGHTCP